MITIQSAQPIISLEAVTFSHGSELILDDVSLTVEPGEFLALLGPNGSGKTTLLRVVTGLVAPDRGTVRVMGLHPANLGEKRRRIGVVPQVGQVEPRFPVTAFQVVMMGRYPAIGLGRYPGRKDREAVWSALERLDARDLADQPLASLSGGQRQRVFLARALVNHPELLLLDEPTGGLDTASIEQFYALLKEMHQDGMTILLISHDIGVVVGFVDRVACLNHRLVAHGRPESVMGEEVLREMYGSHALFFDHGRSPHMVVPHHDD